MAQDCAVIVKVLLAPCVFITVPDRAVQFDRTLELGDEVTRNAVRKRHEHCPEHFGGKNIFVVLIAPDSSAVHLPVCNEIGKTYDRSHGLCRHVPHDTAFRMRGLHHAVNAFGQFTGCKQIEGAVMPSVRAFPAASMPEVIAELRILIVEIKMPDIQLPYGVAETVHIPVDVARRRRTVPRESPFP